MFRWLYRYVLRGIGIVFVAGIITALLMAISSQWERAHRPRVAPARIARP